MTDVLSSRRTVIPALGALVLLTVPAWSADAPAPSALTIAPSGRANLNNATVDVTLSTTSGTFSVTAGKTPAVTFVPLVISATNLKLSSDNKSLTATFAIQKNATGLVRVVVRDNSTNVYAADFDTP
jgi:hypothetical protein